MSTVDVLTMAAAPAPVASQPSQPRQAKSDGFARELEAATRPLKTRSAQTDDNESRPAHEEKGVADTKVRRAHERHDAARRAQADARESAGASSVNDTAADKKSADAKTTGDKAAKDETSDDKATAGSTTTAAPTEGNNKDVSTTDSAGPGTASSGEASQDPAVITLAVSVTATTADVAQGADAPGALTQAASAVEPGAAAIHQAGVTGSRSTESAPTKVTDAATPAPAASGEKVAGPVAGDGMPAGGQGGQPASEGSQEQARQGLSPSATSVAGASAEPDKAADSAAPAAAALPVHAAPRQPQASLPTAAAQIQFENPTNVAPPVASVRVEATPSPTADLPPTAAIGPAVMTGTSPAQAPVVAPASASAPSFPVPLASQLSGQLASLRQLPQGEHVLTLTVNPETFGPVKVVAHISRDGVSLEIFGASDQARAALKAALPDLRRDLAGTGLEPKLEIGTGDSSGRDFSGDTSAFAREGDTQQRPARQAFASSASSLAPPVTTPTTHATRRGGLDLVL